MIQYKPEVGAHLPERKIWTAHYTTFMTSRNKSISKIPVMGYKELDLYSLYKEVLCYGGFQKVSFLIFEYNVEGILLKRNK